MASSRCCTLALPRHSPPSWVLPGPDAMRGQRRELHADRLQRAERRSARLARGPDPSGPGSRGDGLRLRHGQRPRRHSDQHPREISLYRQRRIPGQFARRGRPPIWVGGESGPALRRAARLGDAWYPIGTNPSFPLDSLARYRAGIAKLRGMVEKEERDPGKVALAYRVQRYGPEVPATAGDGDRRLFSGTPAQIADDLKGLRDLGVAAVDLTFPGSTVEEVVASMRSFRD